MKSKFVLLILSMTVVGLTQAHVTMAATPDERAQQAQFAEKIEVLKKLQELRNSLQTLEAKQRASGSVVEADNTWKSVLDLNAKIDQASIDAMHEVGAALAQ